MELGAQNKKQLFAVVGLFAALALVVVYEFAGSSSPTTKTSSNVPTVKPAQRRASGKNKRMAEPRLDPTLDLTLLASTEQMKYAGNGRNIFVAGADIPAAVTDGTKQAKAPEPQYVTPPPPPPPPITLKFFGFASKPGEPKKVFLSQGEDVFIAAEGDIVDRRYKVLKISPTSVDIEDVLYNNRQLIPLTQG
jgi:hypothetical protein